MNHRSKKSRAAGVLLMEVMFGLILMATLISVLAATTGSYRRGMRQLAERRAAVHLAEQVLSQLEVAGTVFAPLKIDPRITIRIVALPDVAAPRRHQWVRVTAAYSGGEATLTGLTPSCPETRP